jgi:hypothetical protein
LINCWHFALACTLVELLVFEEAAGDLAAVYGRLPAAADSPGAMDGDGGGGGTLPTDEPLIGMGMAGGGGTRPFLFGAGESVLGPE